MMSVKQPDLTVTIVSRNTRDLLRACIRAVETGMSRGRLEIHVVDNASSDGSLEMVRREFPDVQVIANSQNVGFARANNQSWKEARGRYWLLLNSDAEPGAGALDALIDFMDAHPRAGLATARLVNPDGTPQHCAQPVPSIWKTLFEAFRLHKLVPASTRGKVLLSTYWTYDRPIKLGWTWGTALIARRKAVEEIGPLSEEFFMYGEDLEWCLRMRRSGWEVWFCPEAEVVHLGGESSAHQWNDNERASRKMDGFYHALKKHRSSVYVRALQAVTTLALGIELFVSRLRRRDSASRLSASLAYHLRSLRGTM